MRLSLLLGTLGLGVPMWSRLCRGLRRSFVDKTFFDLDTRVDVYFDVSVRHSAFILYRHDDRFSFGGGMKRVVMSTLSRRRMMLPSIVFKKSRMTRRQFFQFE
jgi:hypothetical protein